LKSLSDKDVLIAPDLGDISAATFERSKDAIRIGAGDTRTRRQAPGATAFLPSNTRRCA
jgi:hypothetical protein